MRKSQYSVTQFDDSWKSKSWIKRVSDDPTNDLKIDLPRWRNQSRFLHASNPLVFAATQSHSNTIIGRGLIANPKPKVKGLVDINDITDQLKDAWEDWSNAPHIDGQQDMPSVLRSIVAAIDRDGEVLVYITKNNFNKIVIDLISSDRISDPPKNLIPYGKDVYLGVQLDKRVIDGYWIKDSFNGTGFSFFPSFDDAGRIVSVLLRNPSNTDRLNSYRGVPLVSSALSTIEKLDKLMDSELKASILKTLQYGVYKAKSVPDASKAMLPAEGLGMEKIGDTNILVIPQGDDLDFNSGSEISNKDLPATVKLYLNQIAAVYDMSSAILFNNLEDNSYSSNSTITLMAWEKGSIWRNYLDRNLLTPLYKMLVEMWCSDGTLYIEFSKGLARVEMVGRPNYPIKSKDIYESQQVAIDSNQKSLIQVCAEFGLDAFQVIDDSIEIELYRKNKRMEKGLIESDTSTDTQSDTLGAK